MAVLRRLSATPSTALTPFLRPYHIAAAAPQPQFDFEYDYNSTTSLPHTAAVTAVCTEGSRTLRGVQWVFIGNPNAKKHIYAEMISKLLHVPRISISSLLRHDLNPRSPLYKQIADALNRGKLVPESIIFGLLSERLEDGHYRGESGFILDGIPRTRLQAEVLDQLVDIDLVVNFKCSEDHSEAAGSPADSNTSRARTRSREQMHFLEDYYQSQEKLIDFQVGNAPGETWKGLLAALHLQHMNAVRSSRALPMGFRVP